MHLVWFICIATIHIKNLVSRYIILPTYLPTYLITYLPSLLPPLVLVLFLTRHPQNSDMTSRLCYLDVRWLMCCQN